MFTFFGVLFILVGLVALFAVRPFRKNLEEQVEKLKARIAKISNEYEYEKREYLSQQTRLETMLGYISPITTRRSWIAIILGIMLLLSNGMFFWAEAGKQYFLVYPWGARDAVMSQGIKPRLFAKVTAWDKWIDIAAPVPGEEEKFDKDEMEGIMNAVPIRFIDQVTADMYPALRFQIPVDEQDFIDFAVKYRTVENLVYNTLIPAIKEQCVNTGYMFSAQDYISGAAQAFRQTFDEMLSDGAYVVNKEEIRDTTWAEEISQTHKPRSVKDIQIRYSVEKVLDTATGLPARVDHEITENKIIVSQVIVSAVDLDPEYKERLKEQKAESAKRQLEQQKIETAKIAQQRVIAEGEQAKAEERVTQEREQVKQLIAIETKLKQERTNKELAAIALETERLNAQKKKVAADAIFYENSKLVAAGLTPQQQASLDSSIAIGVAREIAKVKFPNTMIITGQGGESGTPLEALIGAAMAKQLTEPTDKK